VEVNQRVQYLEENQTKYVVDVIFCDYQLEHGITAIDILDIAKEIPSLPPIVVMTANTAQIHTEARQAIDHGARGYIIKSKEELAIDEQRSSFVRDIFTSTHRVYEEHQQRVAYNIASSIQIDISTDISERIKVLAQKFCATILKYYPYYTIIIRTYTQGSLNLLDSNIDTKSLSKSIDQLSISENPILNDLINGKETIKTNVDMQDAFKNKKINLNAQGAVELLQLHKGIIAKVQDNGLPLGTVSIYCSQKDREFDTMSISYFEHVINAFSMQWKQIHQNIRSHEVLSFINNILHIDNEQEVWDRLLTLIHKHYNSDSQKTKSTIKIHNLKANTLERISCDGEECDEKIKTINIYDPNISAWVFRNKQFCVLGAKAFVSIDVNSKEKELNQAFINKLTKERADKNIKYVESNPDILSELCIPILLDKQPIGILNLESTHTDAYQLNDKTRRKSIEKLLDVAARRIDNIRHNNFSQEMIETIAINDYRERFEKSQRLLEKFIGYNHFSVIKRNKDGKLAMEYVYPEHTDKTIYNEDLNKQSAVKNFLEENKEGDYTITSYKNDSFKPIQDSTGVSSQSQCIFKMKSNHQVIGAVNFEFIRKNPLTAPKINSIKGFINWLAKDIMDNEAYMNVAQELKKLNHNLMDISHTYKDYIEIENKIDTLQKESIPDKEILTYVKHFTTGLTYIFKIGSLATPEREAQQDKFEINTLIDVNSNYIKKLKKFLDVVPRLLKNADDTNFNLVIKKSNSTLKISRGRYIDIEAIFFEYIFNAVKQNKSYGANKNNSKKQITITFFLTDDAIYIGNDGYAIPKNKRDKVFVKNKSWMANDPDNKRKKAGLGIGLSKCKVYLNAIGWDTKLIETPNDIEALRECTVVFKFNSKDSHD